MSQLNCLNLCEIIDYLYEQMPDFEAIVSKVSELAGFDRCERIYVGSYFCGQYFLHQSRERIEALSVFCKKDDIPITLVIPTFSQKDLVSGKEKIAMMLEWLKGLVDEVVVNDYGMLVYIQGKFDSSLYLGRLFAKDYRDPRYEAYFNQVLEPKIINRYMLEIIKTFQVKGIEFDPTHIGINFKEVPKELIVGVHTPYCYMTTGHICEYASLEKEISKKFRPNSSCKHECSSYRIHYDFKDGRQWVRIGRTIYFENRECTLYEIENLRMIYFPIDMEVEK